MSLFGGSINSKWIASFEKELYEAEYRYKKNIGEFAIHLKEDVLKWLLLVSNFTAVEMIYTDYERGTPPEQSARRIVEYFKKQNTDMGAVMNNSLSAALKIADTLTKRVDELERQIKELKK